MGTEEYWRDKITSRYKRNLASGTIKNSEWVSNCFFCIQTPEQGAKVLRDYFSGNLPIGPNFPPAPDGFVIVN